MFSTREEPLLEGKDFYFNEDGRMVMTEAYLLKRGHCCQSGCTNCPYGYHEKANPEVPPEYKDAWKEDPYQKYIDMADEMDDQ